MKSGGYLLVKKGKPAERKSARKEHKAVSARSRLEELTFGTFLFIWRCRFFRVFFVPFPLSLCMESTSYVLSFRMVFFLPYDHGLDFGHQLM